MQDQTNEGQEVEKLLAEVEKFKQAARKKLDATMKNILKKVNEVAAEAEKAKTDG